VVIEAPKRDKRGKSRERGHRGKGSGESKASKKADRVEVSLTGVFQDIEADVDPAHYSSTMGRCCERIPAIPIVYEA
jgi:hypothetical protein